MKLMSFIAEDPLNNLSKIWTEYLPNDPYCQQGIKPGRGYLLSKTIRCNDCLDMETLTPKDGSPEILFIKNNPFTVERTYNVRPRYKYYGSMKGRLEKLIEKIGKIYLLCCPESESSHHYIGTDSNTLSILSILTLESMSDKNVRTLERVFKCQDRLTVIRPMFKEVTLSLDRCFKEIQSLTKFLEHSRFSLGTITMDTILFTEEGIKLNNLKNCSFDLNEKYRLGPILNDTVIPSIDVFAIERYPERNKRYYFQLLNSHEEGIYSDKYIHILSKYGIPVVSRSLDFYRLLCIVFIKHIDQLHDISSTEWFRKLFLPTEHQRVIKKIKLIERCVKDQGSVSTLDMIHCLYDKEGAFSLRCDVTN